MSDEVRDAAIRLGTAAELHARSEALARYETWEQAHRPSRTPAEGLAAAGFLYELLPRAARDRNFDPRGVVTMHRRLSVLIAAPA